jgi:type IV pilus assembly protein PilM
MGGMKITNSLNRYFFEDKPLFGLDIGHEMLHVMQLDLGRQLPRIKGYGSIAFDPSAIQEGVIVKPELIAKAAVKLFGKELIGDISTNHLAVSLPAARALTRAVRLPKMNSKDIDDAVQTEAEQYLATSIENLYLDYNILLEDDEGMEVFVVAMPKNIVDSYLVLTRILGLEAVLFDTAIGASARLFARDKRSDIPSVLIDFGAESADITVFNKGLVVTGTVAFGGDNITEIIARALNVSPHEAMMVKSKYGLSKSEPQKQIITATAPSLELLLKEIRRTIRYYEQRYTKEPPISQIVTMGGGANMPGLADYLTEHLRLPVRTFDPVSLVDFGNLHQFYTAERMSYVTVAGLAITDPAEIFK